jgi:hypothetical protein
MRSVEPAHPPGASELADQSARSAGPLVAAMDRFDRARARFIEQFMHVPVAVSPVDTPWFQSLLRTVTGLVETAKAVGRDDPNRASSCLESAALVLECASHAQANAEDSLVDEAKRLHRGCDLAAAIAQQIGDLRRACKYRVIAAECADLAGLLDREMGRRAVEERRRVAVLRLSLSRRRIMRQRRPTDCRSRQRPRQRRELVGATAGRRSDTSSSSPPSDEDPSEPSSVDGGRP